MIGCNCSSKTAFVPEDWKVANMMQVFKTHFVENERGFFTWHMNRYLNKNSIIEHLIL